MLEPTSSSESFLSLALFSSGYLLSIINSCDEIMLDLGLESDEPVLILKFLNFSNVFTDFDPSFVELF
jgi:hypothetical protein